MPKAKSIIPKVVVDACVGRSAGINPTPDKADSYACCEVLSCIREGVSDAYFDDLLLDEWDRHKSAYGLKWLMYMATMGRMKKCPNAARIGIVKRLAVISCIGTRAAMQKDAHLIGRAKGVWPLFVDYLNTGKERPLTADSFRSRASKPKGSGRNGA